jgi:fumarate reductase flavoprotein subunit
LVGGARAEESRIRAKKIILACNGFAANADLVRTYCPEIAGAQYFGARGSNGEAVLWGSRLGAALGNMGAYQGYAAVTYPHGQLLSWTTIEKGGILVTEQGERFGNEGIGYSGFAKEVLARQGKVFAVFDERIRQVALLEEEFRELFDSGGIKSLEVAGVLAQTMERYNLAAQGGHDEFGRTAFALAPLQPPFWTCEVVPGLVHTQGGLKTDTEGRVLTPDGKPVPNLFAGGGAAAGISGRTGARGYLSGNGLLTALGLGWLAAGAAAQEIRRGES